METHKKVLLIFLIGISFLFFIISQTQLGFSIRDFLEKTTDSTVQFFSGKVNKEEAKLQTLQKENINLLSKLSQFERLKRENNALSDQFAVQIPRSQNLLPATVIGRFGTISAGGNPQTIILDKGSLDGVKVGQGVVVGEAIVGKIKQVSGHRSFLMLLFDRDIQVSAKTVSESGTGAAAAASGIVKGDGNGSVIFGNVVLKDTLKKGDLVVTSEDVDEKGLGFLPDLVIGKIISIEKKASDLFQSAKLQSPVDISKVEIVFILKD